VTNAVPIPWRYLKTISHNPETEKPHKKDEIVKIITPILKNRLIPLTSPSFPTGRRNIAVAKRNEVITQLRVTASRLKLFSIAGKAMFIEEMRNVPIKEVTATTATI